MKFNVPNLYYVAFDGGFTHIARTMVAGGVTECGQRLVAGQSWSTKQPDEFCQACAERITNLSYPGRGLNLDEKHQEWLHLKDFAP